MVLYRWYLYQHWIWIKYRVSYDSERYAKCSVDRLNDTNWILISFKLNFMFEHYELKAFCRSCCCILNLLHSIFQQTNLNIHFQTSHSSTLYRLVNRVILSILYQYGNNIISFESGWYLVCIIYCEFSSERDAISIRNFWLTNKWKWVFDHTKCRVWKFLRIVFGPQMQKLVSNFDFY